MYSGTTWNSRQVDGTVQIRHGLNENVATYVLTKFAKENVTKIENTVTVLTNGTATFKATGWTERNNQDDEKRLHIY